MDNRRDYFGGRGDSYDLDGVHDSYEVEMLLQLLNPQGERGMVENDYSRTQSRGMYGANANPYTAQRSLQQQPMQAPSFDMDSFSHFDDDFGQHTQMQNSMHMPTDSSVQHCLSRAKSEPKPYAKQETHQQSWRNDRSSRPMGSASSSAMSDGGMGLDSQSESKSRANMQPSAENVGEADLSTARLLGPAYKVSGNSGRRVRLWKCGYPDCTVPVVTKRNNVERHVWTQHIRRSMGNRRERYWARLHRDYVEPYIMAVWHAEVQTPAPGPDGHRAGSPHQHGPDDKSCSPSRGPSPLLESSSQGSLGSLHGPVLHSPPQVFYPQGSYHHSLHTNLYPVPL
eukprot:comp23265_c5_seq1/m.38054 comp23265_c5_seq1/g.38054  ORF comp23265_c5_seq1/g.38054 comp23265_c5_seq1/m.38054 type:complete len:340 (-) comp23265_c5_seq1:400-1419(-)